MRFRVLPQYPTTRSGVQVLAWSVVQPAAANSACRSAAVGAGPDLGAGAAVLRSGSAISAEGETMSASAPSCRRNSKRPCMIQPRGWSSTPVKLPVIRIGSPAGSGISRSTAWTVWT